MSKEYDLLREGLHLLETKLETEQAHYNSFDSEYQQYSEKIENIQQLRKKFHKNQWGK